MRLSELIIMYREAIIVIGLIVLVLGAFLFALAKIWAKFKFKNDSPSHVPIRVTKAGWIIIPLFVIILFGGFSLQYIAPETIIGKAVQTSAGRFVYMLILLCIFWALEMMLKTRGIKLIEKVNSR